MSQYEQENDLGGGGGEVDEATMEAAWSASAERRATANTDEIDEADLDLDEDELQPPPA